MLYSEHLIKSCITYHNYIFCCYYNNLKYSLRQKDRNSIILESNFRPCPLANCKFLLECNTTDYYMSYQIILMLVGPHNIFLLLTCFRISLFGSVLRYFTENRLDNQYYPLPKSLKPLISSSF